MLQRYGTGRIGALFAPIVLIYFLCNIITAITNIHRYKSDIFKVCTSITSCFVELLLHTAATPTQALHKRCVMRVTYIDQAPI